MRWGIKTTAFVIGRNDEYAHVMFVGKTNIFKVAFKRFVAITGGSIRAFEVVVHCWGGVFTVSPKRQERQIRGINLTILTVNVIKSICLNGSFNCMSRGVSRKANPANLALVFQLSVLTRKEGQVICAPIMKN